MEFEYYPKTQKISNVEFLSKQKKQEQLINPNETGITEIRQFKSNYNQKSEFTEQINYLYFFGKCKVNESLQDFVLKKQPTYVCDATLCTQILVISSDRITRRNLQRPAKDQFITHCTLYI